LINAVVIPLVRFGLAGRTTYLLTVVGHKSGRRYSTPVRLVVDGEQRWLVAPGGERNWVKNARAAGWVELQRAGESEKVRVAELGPVEAGPVLRRYVRTYRLTRTFFEAKADAPLERYVAEAPRHPVFRLSSTPEPRRG
jgi:deazaflavin-dependent oxidoreductase (nitroreductase family)